MNVWCFPIYYYCCKVTPCWNYFILTVCGHYRPTGAVRVLTIMHFLYYRIIFALKMVLVHSASFSKNTEQTSNLQNKLLATSICAVPKTQPVDMRCLQSFLKKNNNKKKSTWNDWRREKIPKCIHFILNTARDLPYKPLSHGRKYWLFLNYKQPIPSQCRQMTCFLFS